MAGRARCVRAKHGNSGSAPAIIGRAGQLPRRRLTGRSGRRRSSAGAAVQGRNEGIIAQERKRARRTWGNEGAPTCGALPGKGEKTETRRVWVPTLRRRAACLPAHHRRFSHGVSELDCMSGRRLMVRHQMRSVQGIGQSERRRGVKACHRGVRPSSVCPVVR